MSNMKRTTWNLSVLMLIYGTLCLPAGPCQGAGYAPQIGRPHPNFTLPNIADGRPVSLSQFRGHKVLLLHLASW
jgi:hypothetical protein